MFYINNGKNVVYKVMQEYTMMENTKYNQINKLHEYGYGQVVFW